MIIRRIKIAGFGLYAKPAEITLPERGVVLISGVNGHGKSSWLEAVSVGLWGQPLRRRTDGRAWSPWQDGRAGFIEIDAAGLKVRRERSKAGKTTLSFEAEGVAPAEWESATHAQRALSKILPSFDVWRRAAVFSGADAAHLALAGDAERKSLIEAMLGLEVFETALTTCAARRKERRQAVADAQRAVDAAEHRDELAAESAARAHTAACAISAEQGAPGPSDDDLARTVVEIARLEAEVEPAREHARFWTSEASAAGEEIAGLESTFRALEARAKIRRKATCAECGQSIPEATRAAWGPQDEAALRAMGLDIEALQKARRGAIRARDEANSAVTIAEGAASFARLELGKLEAARERAASFDRLLADANGIERGALELRARRAAEVERARGVLAGAKGQLAVSDAAQAALVGTRSAVLSCCLGGIEAGANRWLTKLGASYRVALLPTTETKAGAVRDAISIEVTGAGGGQGYGGCSGGERRRIDVALLLALGDVNAAASGQDGRSAIFFDEVMDHLDAEGVEAAAGVLRDLGRERCVVVVTHSDDLDRRLRPDLRIRVERGRVL